MCARGICRPPEPDLALADDHVCYLNAQGHVYCWGAVSDSRIEPRPVRVAGVSGAVKIAVGGAASCAVRAGGEVLCWGAKPAFESFHPRPTRLHDITDAADIAMGREHICVLSDRGQVSCGGSFALHPPRGVRPSVSIEASAYHTCARARDGRPQCWPHNPGKTTIDVDTAALGPSVAAVHAGFHGGCAKTRDGALRCWGERHSREQRLIDLSDVATFSVNEHHGCALTHAGSVSCWGDPTYGALGDGSEGYQYRAAPQRVDIAEPVAKVVVGRRTTCAIKRRGGIMCWGDGSHGQLGNGQQGWFHEPVKVAGLSDARHVAATNTESCVVKRDDSLWCWGGDEVRIAREMLPPVATVLALSDDICAALVDGTVRCRGSSVRMGSDLRAEWQHVPNIRGARALGSIFFGGEAVREMVFALGASGRVHVFLTAWDAQPYAQSAQVLGLGMTRPGLGVAGAFAHGCALTAGGTLRCFDPTPIWQSLSPKGNKSARVVPEDVGSGFVAMEGVCVVRTDGKRRCLEGVVPELGNPQLPAVATLEGAPVEMTAAGARHGCAISHKGNTYCWGENGRGVVGVGYMAWTARPVGVHLP